MLLPRQIVKTVDEGKNYLLQRTYGETEWCIDSSIDTIETVSPFVIVSNGKRILLTNKVSDAENATFDHIVLTNKKPTR